MKRVLIIEDEKDLAELLAFNLEKEGYASHLCPRRETGTGTGNMRSLPDLILLDLMLPGTAGDRGLQGASQGSAHSRISRSS